MTDDRTMPLAGYWPSAWPAECGGPRRQKLTRSPGLDLQPGERLRVITRRVPGLWPVMFVQRAPGELYLQGGTAIGSRRSFGWVWRVDPETLETLEESPPLPSGGHNWCGAITVHANGDLYVVNGRFVHRLSPDLRVQAEHELAVDNAHNGHLILPDGNLVTKDIRIDGARRSSFTVLDPDLRVVDRFELGANSIGRFAADPQEDETHLYVTSATHGHRLVYRDGRLRADDGWRADYRVPGERQAFAWDTCIGSGSVWFQDMGENANVRATLSADPVGSNPTPAAARLLPLLVRLGLGGLFRRRAALRGVGAPLRVYRVSTADPNDRDVLVPFGEAGSWAVAPPLYDPSRRILVCFDSGNSKLGAFRWEGPGSFRPLWQKAMRNTNQLTLYPDTGELLVDDVQPARRWDAVVLDIESGTEKARADTGCLMSAGMWYTPGFGRDFYTTTGFGAFARVFV